MKLGMGIFLLCFASFEAAAIPCARMKSQPDPWVKARVDALVLAAYAAYQKDEALPAYHRVLGGIAGTLRQCKLAEDESFLTRYRAFVEYVETASLDQQPDHELGFIVPDKEYFEETRQYVQVPDFLLAPGFLKLVSRDETLGKAKLFLRDFNLKRSPADQLIFFSYRSRHLGTPDNNDSFERLLIVVPGNSAQGVPEKWVQFGITDRGARVRVRNLSVVSTMSGPDGTSNVYFKDYFRTYRRDGSIGVDGRWELGYGDDNCARCHKSGILPIFPDTGSVSQNEQPSLAAVNERFRAYGSPRFGQYLDATKLGPGIGSQKQSEIDSRISQHAGAAAVTHAMVCGACHEPGQLGSLNWPIDSVMISSFVKDGPMPLGYKLNNVQRNELYRKLIQQYFAIDDANPGILKSWLLGRVR